MYQVVVPVCCRYHVLALGHEHLWGVHLGITKPYNRILRHFFWPAMRSEVTSYCKTCPTCQIVGKPNKFVPPAPLQPIPVMGEPFEHVLVDCVGPLPRTKAGNQFLLPIMCITTRFPEAFPLRKITTAAVKDSHKVFYNIWSPKRSADRPGNQFHFQNLYTNSKCTRCYRPTLCTLK